jgi:protein ImuB
MDDEMREMLAALGIRTAGALAALEAEDVERRWGRVGLDAWRLARGEDRRRPVLARVDATRMVEAELSAPTTTLEPITFLVRAALDSLAATLASDGRAAAAVAITLVLDDVRSALPGGALPHTITREARLARPTARAAHLFEHCRALLERWPLDSGVRGVRVAIVATAPLSGEQGDLLSPEWRDTAAMDAAFARLHAELGAGGVVRPEAREEHRPERAGEWNEGAGSRKQEAGGHYGGDTAGGGRAMALRLLEVPEMVEVEQEAGVPCAVWWRGGRVSIAHAVGPERLSGEWWTGEGYRREYWRCEGGERGDLLVFQDREDAGWYVQGWYD